MNGNIFIIHESLVIWDLLKSQLSQYKLDGIHLTEIALRLKSVMELNLLIIVIFPPSMVKKIEVRESEDRD